VRRSSYNPEDSESARRIKRFISDQLFEKKLKVNEAAAKVNLTSERLYKYLNEAATNNNLPAYLMPIWNRMIGPELMMLMAHESGGAFVELPERQPDARDAVIAAARAMRECAEVVESFGGAIEDGHITVRELRDIKKEIRDAVSALLGLEMVAEEMNK
jgi:hypothetical protein